VTFEAALTGLTDELTVLVSVGGAVPATERPASLVARDAVLAMVGDVSRGLAPIAVVARPRDPLGLAATHPVALLRGQLSGLPAASFPDPPVPVSSPVGRAWTAAGRHASVAQHEWARADPGSWPSGDARWTLLGHLAAVVEAVAILDTDLGTADPGAGLPAGLRVAAEQVRLLAGRGPQPPAPPLQARPDRRPVRVREVAHLPAAEHRLASLLTRAEHVTPADVVRVTSGQGRILLALASALREPPPAGELDRGGIVLASGLRSVAAALPAAGCTRSVATIHPGDPRPLAQAAEISRFLAIHPTVLATAGRPLLLIAAGAALVAIRAVAAVTSAHLTDGRWLAPAPYPTELTWQRSSRLDPNDPPRLLASVRQASRLGDELLALPILASAPPSSVPRAASPTETGLAGVVELRSRRPADPARRPHNDPPSR